MAARDRWLHEWMPQEERYVMQHRPERKADIVFNGAGMRPPTDDI